MINFKKGTAHSLAQVDRVGTAISGITAGMLVHLSNVDPAAIVKGVDGSTGTFGVANLIGFAVNNSLDADVIASGKIGVLLLDGNSVIETDQTDAAITLTNYPIGSPLGADGTTGAVQIAATGDRIIGYVEGVRTLPTVPSTAVQGTTPGDGTTPEWNTTAMLGIKLAV